MKKLVRENLFEKFAEDSDPIADMGIGVFSPKEFSSSEELVNFVFRHIKVITGYRGNLKKILIRHDDGSHGSIKQPYWNMLVNYAEKFVIDYSKNQFRGWRFHNWLGILANKIDKEGN